MIDPVRARELTRLGQRAVRAHQARDAAVVAAVRDGAGVREVARLVGLDHSTVIYIVRKAADDG